VYYSWHNEYPLFLIDDVDAELDRKRIRYLLEYLEGRTQTFITTSKESLVEEFMGRSNVFRVKDGMSEEIGSEMDLIQSAAKGAESI
jgi:DNA replication and repair protein RecF